jgi:hypothetical protein
MQKQLPTVSDKYTFIGNQMVQFSGSDHSGRAVKDIKCLRPLEHWDHGFESTQGTDVCLCLFCVHVR